jgi:molybdopterin-guanine dinucleotide biosynthesis protein A
MKSDTTPCEYEDSSPLLPGLVLAGGVSSRLGQDKTRIVHAGQTLLERSVALLARHCAPVYISCRRPENISLNLPIIVDETPRVGPLGGIITALRKLNRPIFVLACDQPCLEDRFITALLAARNKRPAHCVMTTWLQQRTGFIEALAAIYEPEALPILESGLAEGVYKLSRLIPKHLRHHLPYAEEDEPFFFNINFPADLQRLA